jgi:hypothetical protein
VVRRIRFLVEREIPCVALSSQSAEVGMDLLAAFAKKYELKKNLRNSLNDLLTLAVAQTSGGSLHTADRLLARFGGEHAGAPVNETATSICP